MPSSLSRMRRRTVRPLLALFAVIIVIGGIGIWLVASQKLQLTGSSDDDASADWSAPMDQPPPAGFSYGDADPSQPIATREQVIARANQFYIDAIGEENFKKYYERLPQRDAFSSLPENAFDFIGYISKVSQINGYDSIQYQNPTDAVVFVQVNRTNLKEVYGSAPDCAADASQCDYKITKQQAMDIARQRGLGGELVVMIASDSKGRYFLETTSCQDKKAAHIDYSSGKVIRVVEGCEPFVID